MTAFSVPVRRGVHHMYAIPWTCSLIPCRLIKGVVVHMLHGVCRSQRTHKQRSQRLPSQPSSVPSHSRDVHVAVHVRCVADFEEDEEVREA